MRLLQRICNTYDNPYVPNRGWQREYPFGKNRLLGDFPLSNDKALPADMLLLRTVFLPKKQDAREPENFRHITIPPIILKGLHKVLAKRMEKELDIGP
ncbi:hypothetical protein PUN28_017885 [Cardiocondyla obscurior]|uniref:Uncharacterized protein n=1 Tax=Cardiocondyla obscurior TaxID=286306 RepID=A0AAW2EKJ5_9HYME